MRIDDEITVRTANATNDTKLKVYKTVVYARETWTAYQRNEKKLNHFYLRCLKSNVNSRGPEEGRDAKHAHSLKAMMRLTGHVLRIFKDNFLR